MAIRVPRLSYEDLRGCADRFLTERHPSGTIPIPIEEIVEFGLGINIIPLPGLHADHGIDGFLSADMTEISVDLYVFESRPARYRFTLAHEVAHVVLHGDALKQAMPATIPDWKQFVRDLPEADREWLEYQAYAFAGLVLVPRNPLLREYSAALRRTDEAGINLEQFPEVARQYMNGYIKAVLALEAVRRKRDARYDKYVRPLDRKRDVLAAEVDRRMRALIGTQQAEARRILGVDGGRHERSSDPDREAPDHRRGASVSPVRHG